MQTIQDIYAVSIQPLPEGEKLKLATLILEDVTRSHGKRKNNDTTEFFGMFETGDPDSANNDKIDADLARAYEGVSGL